jgi:predicted phosphohydrolase
MQTELIQSDTDLHLYHINTAEDQYVSAVTDTESSLGVISGDLSIEEVEPLDESTNIQFTETALRLSFAVNQPVKNFIVKEYYTAVEDDRTRLCLDGIIETDEKTERCRLIVSITPT